jgi:hypothetical protein
VVLLTRTEHFREHDHHLFGVFPDSTWRRLIDDSGLELVDVDVDVFGGVVVAQRSSARPWAVPTR